MNKTIRDATLVLTALLLAPLAALCAAGQPAASGKPNLILILADDLGYGDAGCYGGKLVATPAIDSLARDGIRCTDGYVTAPVCAPSRCGIMTGAYNQRFGIQWNNDYTKYKVRSHTLFPQALKAAGYVTGQIGKWNVGADIAGCFDETHDVVDWNADYFPDGQGHYVGVDSATEHACSPELARLQSIRRGVDSATEHATTPLQGVWGPERPGDEYLTDRIGRHATEFIEKHKAHPFFLYLAFNAVHYPMSAKAADRPRFAHLADPPLDLYAAMVASLDANVGRVLAKLKSAGLEQNTLVVFTSDNGPSMSGAWIPGRRDDWPKRILIGSAGPLRGYKGQFFEGGIREPFILRWPAKFKAGTTYRQPVSTMDLYPTFCAAAGAPLPSGTKLDGVNLLPHLLGDNSAAPHETLFWKNGGDGALRQGDWKLLFSLSQPKLQLFNLASDIGETHDLAGTKPELVEQLRKAWLDWSASLPPRANPQPAKPGKGKKVSADAKPHPDRAALFELKDKNRDGKLSVEEFMAGQRDAEAAKKRFEQWDTGKKGFLSREEFINAGRKPK